MLFKRVESVMSPKTSENKHHPGRGAHPDIHTSTKTSEQHPKPNAFHGGCTAPWNRKTSGKWFCCVEREAGTEHVLPSAKSFHAAAPGPAPCSPDFVLQLMGSGGQKLSSRPPALCPQPSKQCKCWDLPAEVSVLWHESAAAGLDLHCCGHQHTNLYSKCASAWFHIFSAAYTVPGVHFSVLTEELCSQGFYW